MKPDVAARISILAKRLRAARFPLAKSLDEFGMSRLANVSEASLWDLASGDFVDRR